MTEVRRIDEGAADGRGKASELRRKEIFDAAARMFYEKGYEATSIQDVAEAVGILKGSLYYYINSKEDLLFGVIQDVHEQGLRNLKVIMAVEGDALMKLRAFIQIHVVSNMQNLVKIGAFFHDFRSLSEERRRYIIAERDTYDQALRELIVKGQEEGVIPDDIDPKTASLAILGMMNWVYQWYRPDGELQPEEIAARFADLVLGGLAVDSGRPAERRQIGALPADFVPGPASRA